LKNFKLLALQSLKVFFLVVVIAITLGTVSWAADPGGYTSNVVSIQIVQNSATQLIINVNTNGPDDTFLYNVAGPSNSVQTVSTLSGRGSASIINAIPGSYSIEQQLNNPWKIDSASCSISGGATTGSFSGNSITSITVSENQTTTCAFSVSSGGKVIGLPPDLPPIGIDLIIGNLVKLPNLILQKTGLVGQTIKEVLETPVGSATTTVIASTGVVMAVGAVTVSGTVFIPSLADIFLSVIRFWGLLLSGLGIKKKAKRWGSVYDSVTKQPLDPANVVLTDLNGKMVSQAITDLDGRYGFLVPPGTYKLMAHKTNYYFPSKQLAQKEQDEVYNNLYFGETIEVKKTGEVIAKNIPMDPIKFDWNEFAKRDKRFMKFYSGKDLVMAKLATFFFSIGFVVAIMSYLFAPRPFNILIFITYIALLLLRILGLKPKSLGHLKEKITGDPLSFALIRIMLPVTNTEISHKISDKYGRYYCLVPKGKYYVKIEKKNRDGSYTLVYTSGVVDASKTGLIKESFIV